MPSSCVCAAGAVGQLCTSRPDPCEYGEGKEGVGFHLLILVQEFRSRLPLALDDQARDVGPRIMAGRIQAMPFLEDEAMVELGYP